MDDSTHSSLPTASQTEEMLERLEWGALIDEAIECARSEPAKEFLSDLYLESNWAKDVKEAVLLQDETLEMNSLFERESLWNPLDALKDPKNSIEALAQSKILSLPEMNDLRRWLFALENWLSLPKEEVRGKLFRAALASLPHLTDELRVLNKLLTPEGNLSENASAKLSQLFAKSRELKKEIANTLDSTMKRYAASGALQDKISDFRDGRFVIPVRVSAQSEVEGIIYDSSVSNQTVYIEPREVEVLNNRYKKNQNELLEETFVVLKEASEKLRPSCGLIEHAVGVLSYWDSVAAKAKLARKYGGKTIQVKDSRDFYLSNSAHPLLWFNLSEKLIQRNTLSILAPSQTLLITGPNTGGKTVFLKLIGLAAIAARTGFFFPGSEATTIPFFDQVFIDLGDSQSIKEHISSFSGHVIKMKEILEKLTPRSLVLLDELNSATDPQEGGALGRAFLETLLETEGVMVVATTHDPFLKGLALIDNRILSASMEFQVETKAPTYKLLTGVPGRSHALEIAERLGMPERVLKKAKGYLSEGSLKFESLLAKLETQAQESSRLKERAGHEQAEVSRLKAEWEEKIKTQFKDQLEKVKARLKQLVEQAQDEIRAHVRKLEEAKTHRKLDESRQSINESLAHTLSRMDSILEVEAPEVASVLKGEEPVQVTPDGSEPKEPEYREGAIVRVPKWKNLGVIQEVKGEKLKVVLGHPSQQTTSSMSVMLNKREVEVYTEKELENLKLRSPSLAKKGAGLFQSVNVNYNREEAGVASQLDLRGKRLDKAMSEVESYLDRAFRGGKAEVILIHGFGTGAIRGGIRELLPKLPYIKAYRDAPSGLGGDGATVVEFDR